MHLLYQVYKWVVFIPSFVVATAVFSTMAITLSILVNSNVGYWGGVLWAKFSCLITPLRFTQRGQEYLQKDKSYVLVSNHQSHYDVLLLVGFLPLNLKWVMKMDAENG